MWKKHKPNPETSVTKRRQVFDIARESIREGDADTALALLNSDIFPNPIRYTIRDNKSFIQAKLYTTLYSNRVATNDISELLAYHNLIDFHIDDNLFGMLAANSNNVYIYCPNVNIIIEIAWTDVPTLGDLSMKIALAFSVFQTAKAQGD